MRTQLKNNLGNDKFVRDKEQWQKQKLYKETKKNNNEKLGEFLTT